MVVVTGWLAAQQQAAASQSAVGKHNKGATAGCSRQATSHMQCIAHMRRPRAHRKCHFFMMPHKGTYKSLCHDFYYCGNMSDYTRS
jgi:hypothetical protein